MNARLILILLFVLLSRSFAQKPIALEQLITPEAQKTMGLQKLSPKEKDLLTQAILKNMTGAYQQGIKAGAKLPAAANPNLYLGVGRGHWIKENIDRGAVFLLEDGSLWEVDHLERLDSSLWLRASNITVVKSGDGMPGFDYWLVNTDDGEKVHAKYLGGR